MELFGAVSELTWLGKVVQIAVLGFIISVLLVLSSYANDYVKSRSKSRRKNEKLLAITDQRAQKTREQTKSSFSIDGTQVPEPILHRLRQETKRNKNYCLLYIICVLSSGLLSIVAQWIAQKMGSEVISTSALFLLILFIAATAHGVYFFVQGLQNGLGQTGLFDPFKSSFLECPSCETLFDLAQDWRCGNCKSDNIRSESGFVNTVLSGCRSNHCIAPKQEAVRCPKCRTSLLLDKSGTGMATFPNSQTADDTKPASYFDD